MPRARLIKYIKYININYKCHKESQMQGAQAAISATEPKF